MKILSLILLSTLISIAGCTSTCDVCTGKKGEEFDAGNTAALAIDAALIYEDSKYGYGGGDTYSSSYRGSSLDDDWDYLPGSAEYRCRSISTG